jgi:hypothetical protein
MQQLLADRLAPYHIETIQPEVDSKTLESQEEIPVIEKVLIFLPPCYHLLLKFHLFADHTVVKIRTDFWRVFICLDDFFDKFTLKKGSQ